MLTNAQYKDLAIQSLTGKWGKGALASIIYIIVYGCLAAALAVCLGGDSESVGPGDFVSNIVEILLLPMVWGYVVFFLSNYRGNDPSYGELFDGFRFGYGRILGTTFLQGLYTALWSMLLLIPGIIKYYSYSMTSFILKDDPTLKYNGAIEESMRMMDGHKMQLFLLDLSMIGWFILSCLTLGIGFLFLVPYNISAHAAFYEDLKVQADINGIQMDNLI